MNNQAPNLNSSLNSSLGIASKPTGAINDADKEKARMRKAQSMRKISAKIQSIQNEWERFDRDFGQRWQAKGDIVLQISNEIYPAYIKRLDELFNILHKGSIQENGQSIKVTPDMIDKALSKLDIEMGQILAHAHGASAKELIQKRNIIGGGLIMIPVSLVTFGTAPALLSSIVGTGIVGGIKTGAGIAFISGQVVRTASGDESALSNALIASISSGKPDQILEALKVTVVDVWRGASSVGFAKFSATYFNPIYTALLGKGLEPAQAIIATSTSLAFLTSGTSGGVESTAKYLSLFFDPKLSQEERKAKEKEIATELFLSVSLATILSLGVTGGSLAFRNIFSSRALVPSNLAPDIVSGEALNKEASQQLKKNVLGLLRVLHPDKSGTSNIDDVIASAYTEETKKLTEILGRIRDGKALAGDLETVKTVMKDLLQQKINAGAKPDELMKLLDDLGLKDLVPTDYWTNLGKIAKGDLSVVPQIVEPPTNLSNTAPSSVPTTTSITQASNITATPNQFKNSGSGIFPLAQKTPPLEPKYTNGLTDAQIAQLNSLNPYQLQIYKGLINPVHPSLPEFEPLEALTIASRQNLGAKDPNELAVSSTVSGGGNILDLNVSSAGVTKIGDTGLSLFVHTPGGIRNSLICISEDSNLKSFSIIGNGQKQDVNFNEYEAKLVGKGVTPVEGLQVEVTGTDGKPISFRFESVTPTSAKVIFNTTVKSSGETTNPSSNGTVTSPPTLEAKYTNDLSEAQIAQLKNLKPEQLELYKKLVDSGEFQPLSALRTASGQNLGVKDPNKLVVASLGADRSHTLALNTSKTNIPGTDLEIFVRDGQPIIAFREGSRFNKFSVTFNSWPGYSMGHESYDLTEGLQVQVLGEDKKLIPFYFESVTPTSAKVVFGTPPAAVAKPSPPPLPPKKITIGQEFQVTGDPIKEKIFEITGLNGVQIKTKDGRFYLRESSTRDFEEKSGDIIVFANNGTDYQIEVTRKKDPQQPIGTTHVSVIDKLTITKLPPVPPKATTTTDPPTLLSESQGNQVPIGDKTFGFLFHSPVPGGSHRLATQIPSQIRVVASLYLLKDGQWKSLPIQIQVAIDGDRGKIFIFSDNSYNKGDKKFSVVAISDNKTIVKPNDFRTEDGSLVFSDKVLKNLSKAIANQILPLNPQSTSPTTNISTPANPLFEVPDWLQQRNRQNPLSSQQDSSNDRLQRIQDLDRQAMASANAAISSSPIPFTRPVLTIGTHYTVPTVQPGHSLEWTIDGLQGVKIRITQSGVVFQKDPATEFEIINNGHVFSINGKIYQIKITIKKEGNSTIPNTIKINELSNHENYVKPGAIQIVSSDKSIAEYPLRLNQNRVVEMELDKDFIIELKDGEEINLKNVKYTGQIQRPYQGQVDLPPGTVSITLIGPDGQKFKTTLVESKQGKEFREASNDSKETIRQEGNYSVRYGADGKEISRTEIKPLGDTPIGLSNGLSLEMLNGKLILRDANGDVVQGSNTPSVSSELDLKSFKGNPIGVSSQGQIGITDISTNTIRPLVNNRIISLGGVDYHCQVEKGFGENNFKITFTNSGNGEKTRIRVDRSELSTLEENSPTAPKEPQNLQESQATTSSKKFKFNPLRLAIVIGVSLGLIGGSIWLVVWALHSLTRNNRAAKALLESLTVDELKDLMDALSKGRGGLPIPTLKTPDGKNFEEAKDFNLEIGTAKKKVTVKINDKGLYERIEGVDKLDDDELDKLMEALSNGRGGLPIPTLKTPDGKNFEEAKDFNLEIGTAKKKVTVKINDKGLYERIDFTKGSN